MTHRLWRLAQQPAQLLRADLTMPRRSQYLLDKLGLPPDADLDDVIEAVEHLRGREIRVVVTDVVWIRLLTGDESAGGCWQPVKQKGKAPVDWIFIDRSLGLVQRVLTCLHELGHMLLDHKHGLHSHLEVVSPATAERIRNREIPTQNEDKEAQLGGAHAGHAAACLPALPTETANDLDDLLAEALTSAFGDGTGEPVTQTSESRARVAEVMLQRHEGGQAPALARGQWDVVPEREAELFATWLCRRVVIEGRQQRPRSSSPDLDARARLMLGLPEDDSGGDATTSE